MDINDSWFFRIPTKAWSQKCNYYRLRKRSPRGHLYIYTHPSSYWREEPGDCGPGCCDPLDPGLAETMRLPAFAHSRLFCRAGQAAPCFPSSSLSLCKALAFGLWASVHGSWGVLDGQGLHRLPPLSSRDSGLEASSLPWCTCAWSDQPKWGVPAGTGLLLTKYVLN